MSSRQQLAPYPVVTNGDMSADVISKVTICLKLSELAYEVSWTGTPTGIFQIETSDSYSLDATGNVKNAGIWNAITLSSVPPTSGSDGNGTIMLNQMPGYAVRLKYVRTSGTGTMQAIVNGKVS